MATPAPSSLFEPTEEPGRYWAEPARGVFLILDLEARIVRTLLATELVRESDLPAVLHALHSIGITRFDRSGADPDPWLPAGRVSDGLLMRRAAGAAVLLVAAIAATVSFLHIERLAVQLGQPALAAWLLPLSVDGTVCAASAALLWAAREAVPAPVMARPMLALGVLATLGANADFGAAHGAAGIALSAWPGVAFVGSAEVALGMVRRSARAAIETDTPADSETVTVTATETDTRRPSERSPRAVKPALAERSSASRARSAPPRIAAIVRANPGITGAELGRKLGVSERQGRRLLLAAQGSRSG